jgi:hypothetical protein
MGAATLCGTELSNNSARNHETLHPDPVQMASGTTANFDISQQLALPYPLHVMPLLRIQSRLRAVLNFDTGSINNL